MSKEEKIRSTINEIDTEILKDTLAILLSKNNTVQNKPMTETTSAYKNFAQAILDLQKKYKFPELQLFTTEADLVYVQAGDRRVLLTEKQEAVKQMPAPDLPQEEAPTIDNAFENIKPNDTRFSHLEL